jgi:WD40 repeat protein
MIRILDAHNGACLHTLEGHSNQVTSVVFSSDPTLLASISSPHDRRGYNAVQIWDTRSGTCLQTLKGHRGPISSVVFSPNTAQLASASLDETVKIWNTRSGICLKTLVTYHDQAGLVTFSSNGTQLASASGANHVPAYYAVEIWDVRSGTCLQTLEGHSDLISSIAFSPDAAQLASASHDKTIRIWDTCRGTCLQTLEVGTRLRDISYDNTSSYLRTKLGVLDLKASPFSSNQDDIANAQKPRYQGWGLSSDGEWMTCNSEGWVWLPSEYRPSCSVVSGKMIGAGAGSGKVWICNFNR